MAFCGSFTVFFFNDTATTEIYTLSLHDALPICTRLSALDDDVKVGYLDLHGMDRSEEHTSELQSLRHLVCRLLLEKKIIRYHHLAQREARSYPQCYTESGYNV